MTAKGNVQTTMAKALGTIIDTVDATGHTGNSINGNIAKAFFSEKCRKLLPELVKCREQLLVINK